MKFMCRCGGVIHTSGYIPNPTEWKVISDELFDEFHGEMDVEVIYAAALSMFKCPRCGRLWFYWGGFDNPPSSYLPEPDDVEL